MSRENFIVILWLFLFTIRRLNALTDTTNSSDVDNVAGRFVRQTITDEMLNQNTALDPGTLVKNASFCKQLPIDVKGNDPPESSPPPVNYTIYYIDDTTPNTLHVVVQNIRESYRYDYLVVMAVNELGVPIGHFHLLVCATGAKRSGQWVLGLRCNKGKDPRRRIRRQYGNPHMMYVEKDPKTGQRISIQSIFWSWIPRDGGDRPNLIQFRMAVIEKSTGKDKYWLITTPPIKFINKWIFIPPIASEGFADIDNPLSDDKDDPEFCYVHPVKTDSPGNFLSTALTKEIPVNEVYLSELFPLWFNNPSKSHEQIEKMKMQMHKEIKRSDLKKEKEKCMSPPSMGSVIRSTKNHKEIYAGCSVVKNCLGETDSCVEMKNCKSLLTYRNMEYFLEFDNYFRFELQVYLGQGYGYAAMGISTDKYMGDDSVVECSVDDTGTVSVRSSWNFLNKTNTRTGSNCTKEGTHGENLKVCKIALRKNVLACSFHLRKDLFIPEGAIVPRKRFNLQKNKFYIFQASGSDFVKGTSALGFWSRKKKQRQRNLAKLADKKRGKRDLHNKTDSRRDPRNAHEPSSASKNIGKGKSSEIIGKGRGIVNIKKGKGTGTVSKTIKGKGRSSKNIRGKGRAGMTFATPDAVTGIGKHKRHYQSGNMINLEDLEIVDGVPPQLKYIKWHVAIVVVAFIALVPNGVFVARYFKETWTAAMIFNTSIWRLVHKAYMISVVLLLLIDCIIMLSYKSDIMGNSTHSICGYVFYAVVIFIQPILGFSTSHTKDTLNYLVRVAHWGFGTLVKVFANVFIAFSPQMVSTRIFIGIWVICFLELLFNIIMHAVMTVMYHNSDAQMFRTRRDSQGRWNRAFNPLPMQKIHRAMPGQRRRFLLYLWLQFGTAVFASLIIIPYVGYNRLYVCKDEPLALYKVTCQNPGKYRTVL